MRDVPEEMAARIESGAATLCHAWLLTRADGFRLGFTDHDRDLTVDGVTCHAEAGWTRGAMEGAVGAVGTMSVAGGLDHAALTEADLEAGHYDGASVDLFRVDWARPDLKVALWRGRLAKIRCEGEAFVADLEGPMAGLDRVIGRTFGRDCDATLGDARCGVDLAAFPGAVCDRRWATCVGAFANTAGFRGFPDIPGDDFLAATPVEGTRNDGGSRR
ncbi:MAG: DUF2163 domain-containing protein [Brevundimonas sp.]|nr:MAG: DUF2163 domain-containing protein [Brevundimonas sp.]